MQVLVVGVALADVAGEAVDRQVHVAEAHGLGDALLAVDRDFVVWVLLVVPCTKRGALDEHAAGAAGRIEDAPVERLDHLHDQLDERGRREELAALLPLGHGELAQKILVDLAEGVALDVHRDRGEHLEQGDQRVVVQPVVGLGQHVAQVLVLRLDGAHGVVDGLADVGALRQREQLENGPPPAGTGRRAPGSRPCRWLGRGGARPILASRASLFGKSLSAKRRKMRPRTGTEYSEALSLELARSSSAEGHSRFSISL